MHLITVIIWIILISITVSIFSNYGIFAGIVWLMFGFTLSLLLPAGILTIFEISKKEEEQ